MNQWNPMDTAPKDKAIWLLWGNEKRRAEWNEAWGYQGWFLAEGRTGVFFPEGRPDPEGWLPIE